MSSPTAEPNSGDSAKDEPAKTVTGALRQYGSARLIIIIASMAGIIITLMLNDFSNLRDLEVTNESNVRSATIYTGILMSHVFNVMIIVLVLITLLRQLDIKARLYPSPSTSSSSKDNEKNNSARNNNTNSRGS
jgi:hypothetical protein